MEARRVAEVTTGDYFDSMRVVGVKALKARLSEYLRAVRLGDTILVTDRDQVIAELRPATGRVSPREDLEEGLERLAAGGELTRAAQPKEGWTWRAPGLGLPPGSAMELLGELRGDR